LLLHAGDHQIRDGAPCFDAFQVSELADGNLKVHETASRRCFPLAEARRKNMPEASEGNVESGTT